MADKPIQEQLLLTAILCAVDELGVVEANNILKRLTTLQELEGYIIKRNEISVLFSTPKGYASYEYNDIHTKEYFNDLETTYKLSVRPITHEYGVAFKAMKVERCQEGWKAVTKQRKKQVYKLHGKDRKHNLNRSVPQSNS